MTQRCSFSWPLIDLDEETTTTRTRVVTLHTDRRRPNIHKYLSILYSVGMAKSRRSIRKSARRSRRSTASKKLRLSKRAAALHRSIRRSLRAMRGGYDRMGAWQGNYPEAAPLNPNPVAPGWANAPTICSNPSMLSMLHGGNGNMDETWYGRPAIGRTGPQVSPNPPTTQWTGADGAGLIGGKKKVNRRHRRRTRSRRS